MKQDRALDILRSGRNVYLTGAPGSGKTYTLNQYINYLKHRGVGVGVTASTGIAATHVGGVTIHSFSGVGIKDTLTERDLEALEQKEYLWKRFERTEVLVIDEVSMLHPRMFDTVERVCRRMKRTDQPFGGMQIVLSGDFFQLPPIDRDGSEIKFINSSAAWGDMDIRTCYLDEQYRHKGDTLERILHEVRSGDVSSEAYELLRGRECAKLDVDITPTRLYTHNIDVDRENEQELDKLSSTERVFHMSTKGRAQLVETLKKSVLAPETLRLKKDAVVMFVKNNFESGYVNGTLGVVEDFEEGRPMVRTYAGDLISVFPTSWAIEEDGKVLAEVSQLPIRLAWAITVHKSQGMSLDAAQIDLSKSFVPGQGYVALSRLQSLEGLSLLGINDEALSIHPHVSVLDKHLLSESSKWERVTDRFSAKDMQSMHNEFIIERGGTLDEAQIKKNKEKESEVPKERISTHEKTRILVNEGMSLAQIAEHRGLTVATIIGHLEKLKDADVEIELEALRPKKTDMEKIRKAFKKAKDGKLTPVHRILGGKYSFDELRLARLFL